MIDLKTLHGRTNGATAALMFVESLNVLQRERPTIPHDARPSAVDNDAASRANVVDVRFNPALHSGFRLLSVALLPALHLRPVTARVFGASFSRPLGSKAGIAGVVSLALCLIACDAKSIAGVAIRIVSFGARLAGVVAYLASSFGGGARRVQRCLGHASQAGFTGALRAPAGIDVSFGDMASTARLAGEVEGLACGYRCGSFWRGFRHRFTTLTGTLALA